MSVLDRDVIDVIGVETSSGKVILTIADHLEWSDEESHLLELQEKLNSYLRFVESGELLEKCPDGKGRDVVIAVVAPFSMPKSAERVFELMRSKMATVQIELRHKVLKDKSEVMG